MIIQWTRAGFEFLLDSVGSDFGVTLTGLTVGLYSNNIPWDWERVVGDLVPAAYTGYTPLSLATGLKGPYFDSILQQKFFKLPMHDLGECTALPEVEYGVYLTDTATGLILVGLALLDEPINVAVGVDPYVNLLLGMGQNLEVSSYEADQG